MTFTAEELRHLIFQELDSLDFSFGTQGELVLPETNKKAIKLLHRPAKEEKLREGQSWIKSKLPRYRHFFADGQSVSSNI